LARYGKDMQGTVYVVISSQGAALIIK